MQICKNYRKFLKIIIIPQILNIFLITSCTLKDFNKNNDFDFRKNQLKPLIIPKGINIPTKNKEYNIPYTKKDLEQKNYDIFPPI
ncbi:hypothetical protein D9V68_00475 [Buchnera aphidicola (Hyperomyzus lactucae)]|uniref:Outer membrane protein assembly factor BamC n=1 Tax=Buchnera aphidicola (Hyperomyzus lactucae) TaxID=1241860 RepID=A0A4D6XUB9_9GAMM|nr:hypothetical protein [Buchnera aphidicola]QCI20836.1 hypothetical protein D9V68_00475 [Buchnera aphidicola (Hyperomyzus lactucae)]